MTAKEKTPKNMNRYSKNRILAYNRKEYALAITGYYNTTTCVIDRMRLPASVAYNGIEWNVVPSLSGIL